MSARCTGLWANPPSVLTPARRHRSSWVTTLAEPARRIYPASADNLSETQGSARLAVQDGRGYSREMMMSMNPTVAVVGPGAIGTTVAAALHEVAVHRGFVAAQRVNASSCT
jgi:hypothetical protein